MISVCLVNIGDENIPTPHSFYYRIEIDLHSLDTSTTKMIRHEVNVSAFIG